MTKPARNSPCPCGSGEKFKRCCGAPAPEGRSAFDRARVSMIQELTAFGRRDEFRGSIELGLQLCTGPAGDAFAEHYAEHPITANLMGFLHFDLDIEDGKTLIDLFLRRRGSSLLAAERDYLERLRDTYLGPYEIVGVAPGVGVHVRNLWGEEELRVEEPSTSSSTKSKDVIVARVMPTPAGTHVFESDCFTFPPDQEQELLALLEDDHRTASEAAPGMSPARLLKRAGFRFLRHWFERAAAASNL